MQNEPVTASEAYLASLCRRTFLRMWSYPNLFRDQKHGSRGTHGKELCDLLVVFGDDVIIFSDKHCDFDASKELAIAWRRWHRKSVLDSAAQVAGAERWIGAHPRRIFLDRACEHPFPLAWPTKARFHRIVTCRGSASAVREHFGGDGSLMVTNNPLSACEETPFTVGAFTDSDSFVHVFDEVSLDAVLATLDTVADLCEYLVKRERFFRRPIKVHAAGEPDLLAFYLWSSRKDDGRHDFVVDGRDDFALDGRPTMITIDEGHWEDWYGSAQRLAMERANAVSYAWDALIEKFCFHLVTDTQHYTTGGPISEQEAGIRWMARETRLRRRTLSETLLEAMNSGIEPGNMRRRIVLPFSAGEPYWVLLVFRRPTSMSLSRYREVRRELLKMLAMVVKHLHPTALDIAGIAIEANTAEMSEDLLHLDARHWNDELAENARFLHEEGELFKNPNLMARDVFEFPIKIEKDTEASDP